MTRGKLLKLSCSITPLAGISYPRLP